MDFLNGNIRSMYGKYLSAAFGSALIGCIYTMVDTAVVGQYQGPQGTAALAVVAPCWNLIYSLGLLLGAGGGVIFSTRRGGGAGDGSENQYFTASVIGAAVLTWLGIWCFETPVLTFFGADAELLPLAQTYLGPVKFVFPLFLVNEMLMFFLQTDGNPGRATLAILSGGIFNIFGDIFFVFGCNMGIFGAGLATAIGAAISTCVMLTHFLSRKNTLRLVRPTRLFRRLREILVTGFASFFVDVAMGILTVLFNRQIMNYLGANALSIYGPVIQVSTFAQCCAYSVGQAAQPIMATNFGAGKGRRIRQVLRLALGTSAFFGVFWTVLSMACPRLYIRVFMAPTPEILAMAPGIIRTYAVSFLLLPFNIFSTYYFQAIMKPRAALVVSVARGLVISGGLILILPALAGGNALWLTMPITELLVALYSASALRRYTLTLPEVP